MNARASSAAAGARDPWQPLEPPAARAYVVMAALVVLLPVVIAVVASPFDPGVPEALARWTGIIVGRGLAARLLGGLLMLAITGLAFGVLVLLMRRHRVLVDGAGIEVATTFYRRRLAWADLRLDAARVVAIDERPELKPALKSNGFAVPGFRSGWFRSRGLRRLFVATAGGKKLLWLPTTLGYDVLLQPRQPAALLEAIQAQAAAAAAPVAPGRPAR